MRNLNNTPSLGPIDEAEFDAVQAARRAPLGCDYQGRHPQAAEATTEVGADDLPPRPAPRPYDPALIVAGLVTSIAIVGALALHVWRST